MHAGIHGCARTGYVLNIDIPHVDLQQRLDLCPLCIVCEGKGALGEEVRLGEWQKSGPVPSAVTMVTSSQWRIMKLGASGCGYWYTRRSLAYRHVCCQQALHQGGKRAGQAVALPHLCKGYL